LEKKNRFGFGGLKRGFGFCCGCWWVQFDLGWWILLWLLCMSVCLKTCLICASMLYLYAIGVHCVWEQE